MQVTRQSQFWINIALALCLTALILLLLETTVHLPAVLLVALLIAMPLPLLIIYSLVLALIMSTIWRWRYRRQGFPPPRGPFGRRDGNGGSGMREPRRPILPTLSGSVSNPLDSE
jgi:membrane protein implicated in regulation of membrane protease activity